MVVSRELKMAQVEKNERRLIAENQRLRAAWTI